MTLEEMQKSIESVQASIESVWVAAERNQKFSTEQILKLQDQITWKLSLEASAADQRLEAFAHLAATNASIDLMTAAFNRALDGFNLTRQQREEINDATDKRERFWIHDHKLAMEAHTKALIDLHVVVAQALGKVKVKSPKNDSNGKDDKKSDDLKAAELLSSKTVEAATQTTAMIKKLEEASITIATQRREEDEERHTPWWARIPAALFAAFFKAKPLTQLIAFLMVLTFAVSGYVFLRLYQKADETREPEKPYRWERRHSAAPSPAPQQ